MKVEFVHKILNDVMIFFYHYHQIPFGSEYNINMEE